MLEYADPRYHWAWLTGDTARQKALKQLWTQREDNAAFFIGGLGNSAANNLTLGLIPRDPRTHPYFIQGQLAGDKLSMALAVGEVCFGDHMMGGGGVSLALSGGLSYPVSGPLIVTGGAVTAHGAAVMRKLAVEQVNRQLNAQGKNDTKAQGNLKKNRGNSTQDKKLSDGEIKKLKKAGYDIHDLKGGDSTGKIDLYKTPEGEIVIKPKGGIGPGETTNINIKDL